MGRLARDWQRHTNRIAGLDDDRVAAMPLGYLSNERKAETRSGPASRTRSAPEWLEHAFALADGNAAAVVADGEDGKTGPCRDVNLDRRCAVAGRILQQVANQPPQQPGIARNKDWRAGYADVVVARSLLGGERQ